MLSPAIVANHPIAEKPLDDDDDDDELDILSEIIMALVHVRFIKIVSSCLLTRFFFLFSVHPFSYTAAAVYYPSCASTLSVL
jgi:hypothetical protein